MRWALLHPGRLARRATGAMNPRTIGSATAMTVMSTALVVVAVTSEGSQATNVRLDDGAVWVTNEQAQRVGRLNIRIDELDLAVVSGGDPEVLQDGRSVLFTASGGGVGRIDVEAGQPLRAENEIDPSEYHLGGGVGVVLDEETGLLWVGAADTIVAPKFPKDAHAKLEPGSRVVVTQAVDDRLGPGGQPRGKVLVVESDAWYELQLGDDLQPLHPPADADADATTTSAPPTTAAESDEDAEPDPILEPERKPLPFEVDEGTSISAVGDRVVFLRPDGTVYSTDGDAAKIPGGQHRLQQVGPAGSTALVASDAGLFEVRLGRSDVEQLASAGAVPAAPVRVGPCVFGAWSGATPTWFKACNGDVVADVKPIPRAPADAELVFRVNQANVALNSVGDGGVWADHDGVLAYVGNWDDVMEPEKTNLDEDEAIGQSQRVEEQTCVEGSVPPIANADTGDRRMGARPRQSILNVLANDDDPNCEPIAITKVDPESAVWGTLTIIDNGQHLLWTPSASIMTEAAEGATSFQFTYAIEDGEGGQSAEATADVRVQDNGVGANQPPALRPKGDDGTFEMRTVVEEGRAVEYDVLADWWDPDGDDLRLEAVVADKGEAVVRQNGVVRFGAYGVEPGLYNVQVTVSDGMASTTEALEVTVKPSGSPIPPVVADDFLTVVEGATGVVRPLANDSDPNEDDLGLQAKWLEGDDEGVGYESKPIDDKTFEIKGLKAGTYNLEYLASDSSETTKGVIRLRVTARDPDAGNSAPVAVPDTVTLRPDRVVNVDVLANDIDADGDILALVEASAGNSDPERGEVRASIIDRRLLQVEVVPGPTGEIPSGRHTVTYRIDDGATNERAAAQAGDANEADALRARGTVTLLVQPPSANQPPVTEPDDAVVRTGDVVAVPVLQNDTDPDGDQLTLVDPDPSQAAELEAAGHVVWAQGRYLYVRGGSPGRQTIPYSVVANGQMAAGVVSLRVTEPPSEEAPNQAPSAGSLALRAVRGSEVRLRVPLSGLDLDGDSVTLLDGFGGLQGAVSGNRVRLDPENPGVLLFEAGQDALSHDSFTYRLRDTFGATGSGEVAVVVVDDEGWPPQAHDDVFRAKPGRTLSIPVLANDTSPSDRPLELDAVPFFDFEGQPSEMPQNGDTVRVLDQSKKENRGRIEVEVPVDASTSSEHYRISDGRNTSDAWIRVTADPDAPNLPPVANEDVVTVAEMRDRDAVPVRVLDNDYDPDDADNAPQVSIPTGQQDVTADAAGVVTVPILPAARIVLYRLTDAEGGSTIGIIRVPGKENHPPVLSDAGKDPSRRTIEAGSTTPLDVRLSDVVVDPDGDPDIRLTDTEVVVLGGQGSVTRNDDGSGFTYQPPANLTSPIRATVQFEVTDRPGLSVQERQLDPLCNCLALLAIEIEVQASSPPRVLSEGAVNVPQLEEVVTYDLKPLVQDDQDDELTFSLEQPPAELDVKLVGSVIQVQSLRKGDQRLAVGRQIALRFKVTDGKFDAVEGRVIATIIPTNKGKPAAATIPVQQAERDVAFDLPDVIGAAFNPFPDDPLRLVSATVNPAAELIWNEVGLGRLLASTVGSFEVSYVLEDTLGRTARGSIPVVVKGKPRAPGAPRIEGVGDKRVNLSWTAADLQGGTFVAYHVTAVESGQTKSFQSTGGEFDGLVNGTSYTFIVVAENELGKGEASLPSSPAIPDRVPDPPASLRFTDYGDRMLKLEWSPPATAGDYTAIKNYQVSIAGQTFVTGGATSLTVTTGLVNGTEYDFRVQAQNSARENGGWGEWAVSPGRERPSRYPDPPRDVRAVNSGDGGAPRLTVTWLAPASDGGRPVERYEVCLSGGGCQTTAELRATFPAVRGETASFTVRAFNSDKNRSNSDLASSPSVTAVDIPDRPQITGVETSDKTLTVRATPARNSGCPNSVVQYMLRGHRGWQVSPTFTGLANGTPYTAVAKEVLAASCYRPYESPESNTVTATPYGPLRRPTMNVSVAGTAVSWNWNANKGDDGRPTWRVNVSGNCGYFPGSQAGSVGPIDFGYSQTVTCTITVSADGVEPLSDFKTVRTMDRPPRGISTSQGAAKSGTPEGCPKGGCSLVVVSGWNFNPGAGLTVNCGGDKRWFNLATARGDGSFGPVPSPCYHASGTPQTITVSDGQGSASQVSQW